MYQYQVRSSALKVCSRSGIVISSSLVVKPAWTYACHFDTEFHHQGQIEEREGVNTHRRRIVAWVNKVKVWPTAQMVALRNAKQLSSEREHC